MANVKISELPSTTAVTGSDVVPIVQSGLTKQVSFSDFLASPTLFASGIASFLSTPSSANLRAALTDETGTGPAVFATSPTIDNPTVTGVVAVPDGTAAAPALTNTGDTNTGVFFPADNTVAVTTDGTERVRVDASGNVGVGTSSPGAPLDVVTTSSAAGISLRGRSVDNVSDFSFKSNTAATTYGQIQGRSTDFRLQANSLPLTFYTGGAERMLLDTSGNLGLGVTPSAWGSVFKAMQFGPTGSVYSNLGNTVLGNNTYNDGTNSRYLQSSQQAGTYLIAGGTHIWSVAPSGTAGDAISFTQAMTLASSGELLINQTANDSWKLQVSGSGDQIRFNYDRATYSTIFGFLRHNGDSGGVEIGNINGSSDQSIRFSNGSTYAGRTERARITSGGDLLVGTTSRLNTERVTVRQDITGIGGLVVQNEFGSGSQTYRSKMASGANNTSSYHFVGTSGALAGSGTDVIFIFGNGNIQNINNSYGAISDEKLKENITDATPKLNDFMQVRVVNYNLKTQPGQKHIGVIAQELEQVFPSIVEESPDLDAEGNDLGTTTKAVKYSVFVPMLIKALQEQQAIIQSLTARIEALEAQS